MLIGLIWICPSCECRRLDRMVLILPVVLFLWPWRGNWRSCVVVGESVVLVIGLLVRLLLLQWQCGWPIPRSIVELHAFWFHLARPHVGVIRRIVILVVVRVVVDLMPRIL